MASKADVLLRRLLMLRLLSQLRVESGRVREELVLSWSESSRVMLAMAEALLMKEKRGFGWVSVGFFFIGRN